MAAGQKLDLSADNQLNATSGLMGALLMQAEMYGAPAISFKAILDQHVITTESM